MPRQMPMLCLKAICWLSHDSASSNPGALIRLLCSSWYKRGHAFFTRNFERSSWKCSIIPEVCSWFCIMLYFVTQIQERYTTGHHRHYAYLSTLVLSTERSDKERRLTEFFTITSCFESSWIISELYLFQRMTWSILCICYKTSLYFTLFRCLFGI